MQGIGGAALILLQDDAGQLTHDVHLLMIFMGILAISVLLLVIGFAIAGIAMAAMVGRAVKVAENVQKRAEPLLDKTNELIIEFVPKLRTVSDNVEHISTVARAKVDEVSGTVTQVNQTVQQINKTVQDANGRARAQVAHADTMVSDALKATEDLSQKVQQTVRVPIRQVAGMIAGLKAGLETLIERSPFGAGRGSSRQSIPRAGWQESAPASRVPVDPGRPYDV